MQLIYGIGEIYWMTGVIAVGVIYALFAFAWNRSGRSHSNGGKSGEL